jgi:FtsZ-interacting cell division protein ZipA
MGLSPPGACGCVDRRASASWPAREGKEQAVDTTTLIWIIVGIAIVLAIVVVALVLTARGRRTRRLEHQHERAEKLRADARETELQAREHEAEAARARADAAAAAAAAEAAKARAAEASIDAERRAGTIDEHRDEAESLRERQAETLRKADDVDPYVDEHGRRTDATDRPDGADASAADRGTTRDGDASAAEDRSTAVGATRDGGATRTGDATMPDDRARRKGDRDEVAADEITRPPAPPTRTDRT